MAGFHGWLNKNLRGRKGQQGFTLIELLVVVTILGILAAIVTLSLVGLTTNSNVQACNTEYKTVQAALDAFMAANNTDTITAVDDKNDMSIVLFNGSGLYNTAPSATNPNFTRNGSTQFYYSWDKNGKITNIYSDKSKALAPGASATDPSAGCHTL
ncbi:MAG: type II secretion system protein [Chloroflexi bacterium]|nr:MAG: type II secretion system protein [Chloroflexota bacterium]